MRKKLILAFLLALNSVSYAQETKLEDITVIEKKITYPTKQPTETVYTGVELTQKGMEISGERAKSSVYDALNLIPGVNYQGADPYNLAGEQGNIRIRGVRGYLGALTVEGIPNWGGNPIGPRAYIYDLENFSAISLYKGAVPSDLGSGVGNRGGAIELKPMWAKDKPEVRFSQSIGAYEYMRTSIGLQSGKTPFDGRLAFSYSYSEADKWKGPGETGPRNNFNFNYVQPFGDGVQLKLWGNYNELEYDKFRSLNYSQTKNLDKYYELDFNSRLKGIPAQDKDFYKYNTSYNKNQDYFASLGVNITDKIKFNVKPYLSDEDAIIKDGVTGGGTGARVQKRTRDIDKKGFLSDINFKFDPIQIAMGYHFEAVDMEIYTQNYGITNKKNLVYQGYGILGTSGTSYINSPYLKISGNFNPFNVQAGLKYFNFEDAASKGYITQMVKGVPTLVRAKDLDREERTYNIWLPSVGVSYNINENIEAYMSYGKNFIRPYAYLPIINVYNNNRAKFQKAKVTLNDLFEGYDIEESDNIDIGIRYRHNLFDINPTLFFTKHKNLLTTVYDPRVGLNYQQNIGKASGYGLDIETNLYLTNNLTVFFNPSYTKLTYDEDLSYLGKKLSTKDKQIVDTPEWIISTGVIFKYKDFEIIPKMRYVGKRYGDAVHKEEISSFTLFDLRLSYNKDNFYKFKNFNISLDFDNIFDKKYISTINAMDDALTGATTYSVGSPFTVKTSLSFVF